MPDDGQEEDIWQGKELPGRYFFINEAGIFHDLGELVLVIREAKRIAESIKVCPRKPGDRNWSDWGYHQTHLIRHLTIEDPLGRSEEEISGLIEAFERQFPAIVAKHVQQNMFGTPAKRPVTTGRKTVEAPGSPSTGDQLSLFEVDRYSKERKGYW